MNNKLTNAILELMSALNEDQHPDAGREPVGENGAVPINRPEYDAHSLGEYIYGIRVENSAAAEGRIHACIHMQWPRLHCWISEQQQAGVQLEWRHSALTPNDVHVTVCKLGSLIEYTAIIERGVLLDMLLSSAKRDAILERHSCSELSEMAAEDLWALVMSYECL